MMTGKKHYWPYSSPTFYYCAVGVPNDADRNAVAAITEQSPTITLRVRATSAALSSGGLFGSSAECAYTPKSAGRSVSRASAVNTLCPLRDEKVLPSQAQMPVTISQESNASKKPLKCLAQ
jgi:hypothetical protein